MKEVDLSFGGRVKTMIIGEAGDVIPGSGATWTNSATQSTIVKPAKDGVRISIQPKGVYNP